MTRIAITPSMQFHNQYGCSGDVEGYVMGILGQKVVDRLNKYGAPSIQAQRFWTTNEDGWTGVADGAAAWGDLVVAFHTDSAGNQDNDGRGYTGSLLCYHDAEGRALGWKIMHRMLTDFGWPIARDEDRSELYMFRINDTPACLLEIGNHSDPDDCRFMLANLDKFADSIAWGIFEHLGSNPRKDTKQEDDMPQPVPIDSNMTKWQSHVDFTKSPESCLLIGVASGDAPGVYDPAGLIAGVTIFTVRGGVWIPEPEVKLGNAGPTYIWRKAGYTGPVAIDSGGPSIVVQAG